MSNKETGGPAFPSKKRVYRDGYPTNEFEPVGGMTLRDYFAAHANTDDIAAQLNILRSKSDLGILPDNYVSVARYMHADAMLGARKL